MSTRYAIADADGDLVHCGPSRGWPSQSEALLFLLFVPGAPLDWHVVPIDGDDLPAPSAFSPSQPGIVS